MLDNLIVLNNVGQVDQLHFMVARFRNGTFPFLQRLQDGTELSDADRFAFARLEATIYHDLGGVFSRLGLSDYFVDHSPLEVIDGQFLVIHVLEILCGQLRAEARAQAQENFGKEDT